MTRRVKTVWARCHHIVCASAREGGARPSRKRMQLGGRASHWRARAVPSPRPTIWDRGYWWTGDRGLGVMLDPQQELASQPSGCCPRLLPFRTTPADPVRCNGQGDGPFPRLCVGRAELCNPLRRMRRTSQSSMHGRTLLSSQGQPNTWGGTVEVGGRQWGGGWCNNDTVRNDGWILQARESETLIRSATAEQAAVARAHAGIDR